MRKQTTIALLSFLVAVGSARATIEISFDTDAYGNPFKAPQFFVDTTRLSELYAPLGLHFFGPDGPNGVNGGAIVNQSGNWGVDAHSGTNFLGFNRVASMADHGHPLDPETITFDTLVSRVSIFAAGGFIARPFLMQAFDANGILVSSDTITTEEFAQLEVSWSLGIKSIQLSVTSNEPNAFFVFDDLSADVVPEPATIWLVLCAAVFEFAFRLRKSRQSR